MTEIIIIVKVHFNEAIRKAVEEKDRRIQELELSLSNQVGSPANHLEFWEFYAFWPPFNHHYPYHCCYHLCDNDDDNGDDDLDEDDNDDDDNGDDGNGDDDNGDACDLDSNAQMMWEY